MEVHGGLCCAGNGWMLVRVGFIWGLLGSFLSSISLLECLLLGCSRRVSSQLSPSRHWLRLAEIVALVTMLRGASHGVEELTLAKIWRDDHGEEIGRGPVLCVRKLSINGCTAGFTPDIPRLIANTTVYGEDCKD